MRFLVNRQPSVQQRRLLREAEQVTFLPMEAIGEDGVIDSSKVRDKDDASDGYTQFFDGDILVDVGGIRRNFLLRQRPNRGPELLVLLRQLKQIE